MGWGTGGGGGGFTIFDYREIISTLMRQNEERSLRRGVALPTTCLLHILLTYFVRVRITGRLTSCFTGLDT